MSLDQELASRPAGAMPATDAAARARAAAGARYRLASQAITLERRTLYTSSRDRLIRALALSSAIFCVLFAFIYFVLPPLRKEAAIRVVILPPPRTVLLEQPKLEVPPPIASSAPAAEQINVQKVPDPPALEKPAEPAPEPPPLRHRRESAPEIDSEVAKAARDRARTETAALTKATSALDQALGTLSSSLRSNGESEDSPRRARARSVRSGRSDNELGSVGNGLAGSGASADLSAKVEGSNVAIGSLSPPPAPGPAEPEGEGAKRTAGPGVYRTNASLLAVIQKYAAGIQYCYENELKRHEGLRGKLVVAITVAASGAVLEATVVRNTLGSERLESCALGQIREWRFPPVPKGVTTFQAPFVFTPPN